MTADAKAAYKSLGRTSIGRILAAARGKSDAAKKYLSMMDKASKMSDVADEKWAEAKKSYINTGRNRVERILNNKNYDKYR